MNGLRKCGLCVCIKWVLLNLKEECKTGPVYSWYQWKREGYKERVQEGEYDENIIYSCIKM
jgi:hypothetical protein